MLRSFFDLYDRIVRDTLDAIVKSSKDTDGIKPTIVGGMAVQIYVPKQRDILRPTSDIDVLDPANRPYEDFVKSIGRRIQEGLLSRGYQVQLKRGQNKNEVKVMKGQHAKAEELFFAHFTRYSEEMFARTHYISEREVENAVELSIPDSEKEEKARVLRIEDILALKIRRVRKSLRELAEIENHGEHDPLYGSLLHLAEASDWNILANIELVNWCQRIASLQNSLVRHGSTPGSPKKLKYNLNKDIYDVVFLSKFIRANPEAYNRAYLLNAKREVDSI